MKPTPTELAEKEAVQKLLNHLEYSSHWAEERSSLDRQRQEYYAGQAYAYSQAFIMVSKALNQKNT